MLSESAAHHNNHQSIDPYQPYPPCPSDYEAAPVENAPLPGWRNQHPKYVHHVEWIDADNRKHGLTLRTDDRDEMLATLRVVKAALAPEPESEPEGDVPSDEKPKSIPCPQHPHELAYLRTMSTGAQFYSHKLSDGTWCNTK